MNIREQFKLKVFQSEGTEYEKLFNDLMKLSTQGFRSVKPHGNIGDRGNDGWIQKEGKYYQVYAPEELFKNTDKAISKVKSDFVTLKEYWDSISPIKSFYFVLNDKFKGVSPHITKLLKEIKNENGLDDADVFCNASMEELIFTLQQDSICSLLGISIPQTNQFCEDNLKKRKDSTRVSIKELNNYFSISFFQSISNVENPQLKMDERFEKYAAVLHEILVLAERDFPKIVEDVNRLIKCNQDYRDKITQVFIHRAAKTQEQEDNNREKIIQANIDKEAGIANGLMADGKYFIKCIDMVLVDHYE